MSSLKLVETTLYLQTLILEWENIFSPYTRMFIQKVRLEMYPWHTVDREELISCIN
jgi:hypothetical protein